MLVLHDGSPVGGEPALRQAGEHAEQVDGRQELHHRVAEELQSLVVLYVRLCLAVLAEPGHYVY